jgi:hypothetical protein
LALTIIKRVINATIKIKKTLILGKFKRGKKKTGPTPLPLKKKP